MRETNFTVYTLFIHCSWDPQSLYSEKNIKNGSHGTIYTFKNYFATVFFNFQFSAVSKRTLNQYYEIIFFSPILANNNLALKIYCENIVIIYTDFNLNILLKLFFSPSKKIIFFSPILANNNLPLKIYCKSIT